MMKNKYSIGIAVIVIFLIIMGYLFSQSQVGYENDFSKIIASKKRTMATGAWVKEKGAFYDAITKLTTFYIKDNYKNQLLVRYSGSKPSNFENSTSVVVTGAFNGKYFAADELLTKCPSKYEEQFNKTSN